MPVLPLNEVGPLLYINRLRLNIHPARFYIYRARLNIDRGGLNVIPRTPKLHLNVDVGHGWRGSHQQQGT